MDDPMGHCIFASSLITFAQRSTFAINDGGALPGNKGTRIGPS